MIISIPLSGADPGFPVGGGANPRGGAIYDFAKFCEKLHEIEKILGRGGGGGRRGHPPKSATDYHSFVIFTVADPGFPRSLRASDPKVGGGQPIILAVFTHKLHEIEINWAENGEEHAFLATSPGSVNNLSLPHNN